MRAQNTALLLALLVACANSDEAVTADSPDTSRNAAGIEWAAETAILESFPVQLRTTVTATNHDREVVHLTFPDGCIVTLRAYANEARTGEPAWDQARTRMCTMAIEERTVPGGGSLILHGGSDGHEILGDSLPDARYWLSAVLRPDGETIELPAGAADLAVPRE